MKKFLLLVLLAAVLLAGCSLFDIPVTGVSVSPTIATIAVGGTQQLTATVQPSNATNDSVTWATSNATVATVSSAGLVTGVAAGNATIKVTTTDGGKTATCAVAVAALPHFYTFEEVSQPYLDTYGEPEEVMKYTSADYSTVNWWWWTKGFEVTFLDSAYDDVNGWTVDSTYEFDPILSLSPSVREKVLALAQFGGELVLKAER
jgi:transglutaminase/protease-like cytokinesis protein 3